MAILPYQKKSDFRGALRKKYRIFAQYGGKRGVAGIPKLLLS